MDSIKVLSRGGKEIVLHTKNGLLDHISVGSSVQGLTLDSYYPDSILIELYTINEILGGHHQNTIRASQLYETSDENHLMILKKIIREFPHRGVIFKGDEVHILA